MRIKIMPSVLSGKFYAPPSKSFAHRAMICAALSDEKSNISNISKSEDLLATLDCISALGADIIENGGNLEICGNQKEKKAVFPCRESGSTLRFFFPIALALFDSATFLGSKRLLERGISVYEDIFKNCGIKISKENTAIKTSGKLTAGEYTLKGNISSQYISGLLFALPLLSSDSKITVIPPVESKPYINITLSVLKSFGIEIIEESENRYLVKGNQRYAPCNMKIEGDWSNSAVFFALNELGSDISVLGLNNESLQGDKVIKDYVKRLNFDSPKLDISDCPDLAPVLFALAAAKNGAEFIGTKRLKIKESDRAAAMQNELLKIGIETEIFENSVKVIKGVLGAPKVPIASHNDHRIVTAMAMLLTITGGEIDGAEAVSKSLPDFFEALKSLGAEVIYES